MELIKVTPCEHCDECPEVEITDQSVTIGEDFTPFGCRGTWPGPMILFNKEKRQ